MSSELKLITSSHESAFPFCQARGTLSILPTSAVLSGSRLRQRLPMGTNFRFSESSVVGAGTRAQIVATGLFGFLLFLLLWFRPTATSFFLPYSEAPAAQYLVGSHTEWIAPEVFRIVRLPGPPLVMRLRWDDALLADGVLSRFPPTADSAAELAGDGVAIFVAGVTD